MEVDGERVLAIDFYRDTDSEWEVEDWFRLQEALGGLPSASLVAVVAARKDGTAETKEFAEKVLSEFKGVAEDDYAPAFWTLDDLRSDRLFEGHHFFDYRGWPCFLTICDSFKVVEEHRP
jgi:hypothetical protein